MVKFETNVYREKDNKIIGVDVVVLDDAGVIIDNISITDARELNNLRNELDALTTGSITLNELRNILKNIDSSTIINATTLSGKTSGDFAKATHDHDSRYPFKSHATTDGNNGVGTTERYGHNKIINNWKDINGYIAGHSLSANLGKILKNELTTLNNKLHTPFIKGAHVRIGRERDMQGEEGSQILINRGDKIYAKIYANNPNLNLSNRKIDFQFLRESAGFDVYHSVRQTDSRGIATITIDFNPGNIQATATVLGTNDYNRCHDHKTIIIS